MKSGRRILIVYYSLDGHTQRVAGDLALRLGADLEELHEHTDRHGFFGHLRAAIDGVRERPARLRDIGKLARDYDLVIVGSPIWAGKITPAARAYLMSICGQATRIGFFITSGATEIDKVAPAMEKLAGLNAVATVGFTERVLRDVAVYDRIVSTFVAAVRAALSPRGEPARQEDLHAVDPLPGQPPPGLRGAMPPERRAS